MFADRNGFMEKLRVGNFTITAKSQVLGFLGMSVQRPVIYRDKKNIADMKNEAPVHCAKLL